MPSNATIKQLKKLHQKKYRQEAQEFLIEGEKIVCELLKSTWQILELYASENFIAKHQELITAKNCPTTPTSPDKLTKIGNLTNNNQAIALVKMPLAQNHPYLDNPKSNFKNNLTLVLDQINDPGNLGTIIRLADWYGIQQIICSPNSVDLYNPKTLQATKGSFLRVGVVYQDLEEYFAQLSPSTPTYGASLAGQSIHQLTKQQVLQTEQLGVLLLGNESHGISPELQKYITQEITIPKFGQAESLNVALACGIILDNLARLREN